MSSPSRSGFLDRYARKGYGLVVVQCFVWIAFAVVFLWLGILDHDGIRFLFGTLGAFLAVFYVIVLVRIIVHRRDLARSRSHEDD